MQEKTKKLLENSWVGSLVIPLAIILVGALIIFGVTKMLSTDRSHRDLVLELKSKTFGNKWVAAFELSKLIGHDSIPSEEIPWLADQLKEIYETSQDERTKRFIIVTAGALQTPLVEELLAKGLGETSEEIVFHTIAAIGNLKYTLQKFNWNPLIDKISSDDISIKQAAIFALSQHRVEQAQAPILSELDSSDLRIAYSAASALINFKNVQALPNLRKVLMIDENSADLPASQIDKAQLVGMKLGIINLIKKTNWSEAKDLLADVAASDKNQLVATRAKEAFKNFAQ